MVIVLAVARVWAAEFQFIIWSDRDLYRSAALLTDWPTMGAEMNYGVGARVPGGFYHWLIGLPLAVRQEPLDVYRFLLVLDVAALGLLSALIGRTHGLAAGATAAAVGSMYSMARRPMVWLWNPTALPLFLVLGLWGLHGAITRERPRGWVALWAGAFALGAHTHMTSAVWLGLTAGGWVLVQSRRAMRLLPLGLAVAAATYVPYLLGEVLGGYPNTVAIARQRLGIGTSPRGSIYFSFEELLLGASYLLPKPVPQADWHGLWLEELGVGVGLLALWGALVIWRGTPKDDSHLVTRVVAIGVLLSLCLPAIGREVHVEWRYLLATTPAFAWLAGAGAAWLVRRAPWAGGAAMVLVGTVLGQQLVQELPLRAKAIQGEAERSIMDYRTRRGTLEELTMTTGLDGAELAGRLGLALPADEGWQLTGSTPNDYALRLKGETFLGSLPPPCHLVAGGGPSDVEALTPEDVARVVGLPASQIDILRSRRLRTRQLWAEYDPGLDHCPTNMTGRYVATPVEEILRREVWGRTRPGEVAELPWTPGHRWAVMLEGEGEGEGEQEHLIPKVMVALDARVSPGKVHITLHSNQLRGMAHNASWYEEQLVSDPRVRLVSDDMTREVVMHHGYVGANYVATPLRTAIEVPSGRWELQFETSLYPRPSGPAHWPYEPEAPVWRRAVLGTLEVP
jgi:hypothetical protein